MLDLEIVPEAMLLVLDSELHAPPTALGGVTAVLQAPPTTQLFVVDKEVQGNGMCQDWLSLRRGYAAVVRRVINVLSELQKQKKAGAEGAAAAGAAADGAMIADQPLAAGARARVGELAGKVQAADGSAASAAAQVPADAADGLMGLPGSQSAVSMAGAGPAAGAGAGVQLDRSGPLTTRELSLFRSLPDVPKSELRRALRRAYVPLLQELQVGLVVVEHGVCACVCVCAVMRPYAVMRPRFAHVVSLLFSHTSKMVRAHDSQLTSSIALLNTAGCACGAACPMQKPNLPPHGLELSEVRRLLPPNVLSQIGTPEQWLPLKHAMHIFECVRDAPGGPVKGVRLQPAYEKVVRGWVADAEQHQQQQREREQAEQALVASDPEQQQQQQGRSTDGMQAGSQAHVRVADHSLSLPVPAADFDNLNASLSQLSAFLSQTMQLPGGMVQANPQALPESHSASSGPPAGHGLQPGGSASMVMAGASTGGTAATAATAGAGPAASGQAAGPVAGAEGEEGGVALLHADGHVQGGSSGQVGGASTTVVVRV